jgi:hypothetical protein
MSDKLFGKVPKQFDKNQSRIPLDAGTYVAVVKNVKDPNRGGRLSVWIPELGGAENDSKSWITVRYASPFMGSTANPGTPGKYNKDNNYRSSSQTYGFWAVPPDVGNQVLVTFANGDRNRGFWFACVFDRDGHHMIPGNPGGAPGKDFDLSSVTDPDLRSILSGAKGDVNTPLSETNRYASAADPLIYRKKTVHEAQAFTYINQGLDRDIVRGPGRSSSQRDMPSNVYGWSTPGRGKNDPGAGDGDATQPIYERKGGHVFVMDDGDFFSQNQQIRLRSATGHQILLDDTSGTLHIINASGSSWIEMSASGHISMYAGGGINLRSRGDFNIHSDSYVKIYGDSGIEMYTDGKLKMEGKQEVGLTGGDVLTLHGFKKLALLSQEGPIQIDAKGKLTLKTKSDAVIDADRNLGLQKGTAPKSPPSTKGISIYDHDDTFNSGRGWSAIKRSSKSIVSIFPTHEPWNRAGYDAVSGGSLQIDKAPVPNQTYTGGEAAASRNVLGTVPRAGSELPTEFLSKFPGIARALSETVGISLLPKTNSYTSLSAPRASQAIGSMSVEKMSSVLIGIAHTETRGDTGRDGSDYLQINPNTRQLGRYQHSPQVLEDLGYIKPGSLAFYGTDAVDRGDVWTSKARSEGVTHGREYLESPGTQEKVQMEYMNLAHKTMIASGVITNTSPPEHVAGMLAVAQAVGPTNAIKWARGDSSGAAGDRSASGTPATTYYAVGRNAILSNYSY